MKTKLLFILLALALISCTPLPSRTNITNTTNTTLDTSSLAEKGDLVAINFILTLENGTIVDTNNAELAKQHGVKNYATGPYQFILGQSGKVKGFDTAIEGLKLNEHRDTIIPPSEKELIIPLNRTLLRPRFITIPRHQTFARSAYPNIFGKKPIIGDVAYNETLQFKYKIVNMTNESVLGEIIAKSGEEYNLQNTYWPSQVIQVRTKDIVFGQKPEDNQSIQTELGPAVVNIARSQIAITYLPKVGDIINKTIEVQGGYSIPQQFQVIEVNEFAWVIKRYGSLADKKLLLSVDLLELTKNVKKVKDSKINVIGNGNTAN